MNATVGTVLPDPVASPAVAAPPTAPPRGSMPLVAHLAEARRRLVRGAGALVVGVVVGFLVADPILDVLRAPVEALAATRDASLNYDTVSGAFDLKLRIAILAGIVLASPVLLQQLYGFLAPGLTRRERRYVVGFAVAAVPLFLAGCATGAAIMPHVVTLLASTASSEESTLLQASAYVDFVVQLVVAVGIAFVLPVLVVLLNLLGVLPARTIRRSWRGVVVGVLLFAAVATPAADPVSMVLLAAAMLLLFTASGAVAHLHDRRIARRLASQPLAA